MARKDFSEVSIGSNGKVHASIDKAVSKKGQQGTASPEEVKKRAKAGTTRGRKGCRQPRINIALTPDNHEFIKVMATATGHTMAEFTNLIIEAYRNDHPEFMEQAKGFLSLVNSREWNVPTLDEDEDIIDE